MIRKLQIDGFRGFEHFELNDLGRINLLVGSNNCGKTTLLESLQIASSPGELYSIYRILRQRGEDWRDSIDRLRGQLSDYADVRRLFHGHEVNPSSKFEVTSWNEAGRSTLSAEIVESAEIELAEEQQETFEDDAGARDVEYPEKPLSLRVTWDECGTMHGASLKLSRRGGLTLDTVRRHSRATETARSALLISTAALTPETVVHLFGSIVLTPEEDLVIEALKIIEPSIERIATGNMDRTRSGPYSVGKGGILVRCADSKHRIPIGTMGDGIWRMLGFALALVHSEGGLLLIDEIDTGLHFTVMADMWRLIYKTAKRLNVQVFATTHSRDCYESLAAICREDVGDGSEITIQRIERGKKIAVGYTEQEIIAAAERGLETR